MLQADSKACVPTQESAKERGEQAGALAEARARAAAHEEKAIGQAATIHEQAEHNRSLEVALARVHLIALRSEWPRLVICVCVAHQDENH